MAALLECYHCPSCDRFHDFLDPDEDAVSPETMYSYTCPVTGNEAMLWGITAASVTANSYPPGTVMLRRVPGNEAVNQLPRPD